MKDLYAPQDAIRAQRQTDARLAAIGLGGNRPGVSPEQYQRTTLQTRRELDNYIKEEVRNQEKLSKMINNRYDKLSQLRQQERESVKNSKEELEIKSKIARIEENNFKLREYHRQRESTIGQALNARTNVSPRDIPGLIDAFRGGGIRYGLSQIPGAFRQNPAGMYGGLFAGIGSAIGVGASAYGDYTQSPQRAAGSIAGGVQSTIGRDLQAVYARRSAFEAAFNPERQRAAQMALEANRGFTARAFGGIFSNIATGAGEGAAGGGLLGGLGAGIGAVPGAIIGGGLGAIGGGIRSLSDPTQRSAILSLGGLINNRYGREFQAARAGQLGSDYAQNFQNLQAQNPGKMLASQYYEQNYLQNLQAQRMTGLSNQRFYGRGGFAEGGGEFTPEMMIQMASGIQGAGGSTRAMQGSALLGNRLARNLDLTNAGQVLGTISGGVGSSKATEQAVIKILSEGTKLGLDRSEFAEENRRFTQAASEIISRSAAGTEADFARNAKNFSAFMGENTNKGIEAAKTAYEQYQQISSTTTGPRGVMRAAGFMQDKYLNKLSLIERQALMQVPEEQLNENNPLVAGLAEKSGTSVQDFVGRIRGVNQGAVSRFKEADTIRDRLRKRGVDIGKIENPEYRQSLSAQDRQDATELMAYQTTELGYKGQREMVSFAAGTVGRPEQFGPGAGEQAISARIAGTSGRQEDRTITDTARDMGVILQNFRDFHKEIIPTAEAINNFNGRLREMALALAGAKNEAEKAEIIRVYSQNRSLTQTQAGKVGR